MFILVEMASWSRPDDLHTEGHHLGDKSMDDPASLSPAEHLLVMAGEELGGIVIGKDMFCGFI